MAQILREYIENGIKIAEFTKDGTTVSHTVKSIVPQPIEPKTPQPTLEDKVNYLYYKATGVIA